MRVQVDTNLLVRLASPGDPNHPVAVAALGKLRSAGDELCLVPQNLYEFYVVATRAVRKNGLGMAPADAKSLLQQFQLMFTLLPDRPEIYAHWETLVTTHSIAGLPAHDARLVAAMQVHGVDRFLTFNLIDFVTFTSITLFDPSLI